MVTCLYGIGRFNGALLFAIVYGGLLLACIGIGLLFRCNREKDDRRRLIWGILAVEGAMDVLLFLIMFPDGSYRNYGIGAAYGALLYPIGLITMTGLITAWNKEN